MKAASQPRWAASLALLIGGGHRLPFVLCPSLPANTVARPVFFSAARFPCAAKLELVFQAVASTTRSLLGDSGLFSAAFPSLFFFVNHHRDYYVDFTPTLYMMCEKSSFTAGCSALLVCPRPNKREILFSVFLFCSAQLLPLNDAT